MARLSECAINLQWDIDLQMGLWSVNKPEIEIVTEQRLPFGGLIVCSIVCRCWFLKEVQHPEHSSVINRHLEINQC
jgi:hypothetical protein